MYTKNYIISNRYKLINILGRGSFAEVWSAEDLKNKKEVAVKICKAALIAETEEEREKAIQRFIQEIDIMKKAKSPYIVEILDYGKDKEKIPPYKWYYYIIMEKMESTLADYIQKLREKNKVGMKLEEFFLYAFHCLYGLKALHDRGIIHRDIKPSNLLFSNENILNIGDLGIARLSEYTRSTQTMFGTVGYAATELFVHKKKATVQSDIFSLGIAFYEMLTARHPCSDKGSFYLSRDTIRRLITADFYPLEFYRKDLPESLNNLINQMLALNPSDRPNSADEIIKRLENIRKEIALEYVKQANKFIKENDYKKAVKSFKKAVKIYPDHNVHNKLGIIFYNHRNFNKALEHFNLSLKIKENKEAYNNRGLCYYYLKDYDKAIMDFSKAIKLDPKFQEAYNNRGLAYHKKKEYYRAIQNFNKALNLKSNDPDAYNNRGVTYSEQQKYDRAIIDFSRAIKLKPDDNEIYFNRGLAYKRKGNLSKALEDFNKAIKINPDDFQSYFQRALIYKKLKNYKKALENFKKVLKYQPDNDKIKKQVKYCEKKIK